MNNDDLMIATLTGGVTKEFCETFLHMQRMYEPKAKTTSSMQLYRMVFEGWDTTPDQDWYSDTSIQKLCSVNLQVSNFGRLYYEVYRFVRDNKNLWLQPSMKPSQS